MAPDAWPDLSPQDWDATVRALAPLSDLPASDMASLPVVNLDALVAMLDTPASGACP